MTGLEFNGLRYRVIVNGTFCGASEDKDLAERHLQNVQALRDLEPTCATMTVEQLYHDHGKRDPDSAGSLKTVPPFVFAGRQFCSLARSQYQGWFCLFDGSNDQVAAIYCDLVEVMECILQA